jgi:hypothetical protein
LEDTELAKVSQEVTERFYNLIESVRLPIADIGRRGPYVAFVPLADVLVPEGIPSV